MSTLDVIRIPILPLGLVNAHIVKSEAGCVLVDAGLPGSEDKLKNVLHHNGLDLRDIRAIVITHAHVDHAGNAARLRRLTGAPIIAHANDLPYYRRERTMQFCATGLFGRLFLCTGLMYEPYEAFEPDVLLQDGDIYSLDTFGIDGCVHHTPGHTSGSLTVVLADGQALVGDLVSSGILLGGIALTHHPKKPPFEDNPSQVGAALHQLVCSGHDTFFMGHGGPLDRRSIAQHADKLLAESRVKSAAS